MNQWQWGHFSSVERTNITGAYIPASCVDRQGNGKNTQLTFFVLSLRLSKSEERIHTYIRGSRPASDSVWLAGVVGDENTHGVRWHPASVTIAAIFAR